MKRYQGGQGLDGSMVPTGGLSRRQFLAGVAGLGAVGWVPVFRVTGATQSPPNFPPSIALYQQAFQNWSGEIVVDDVWTCAPQTSQDIVTIANWALANGYCIRPRGKGHTWTPLIIPPASSPANVVLV